MTAYDDVFATHHEVVHRLVRDVTADHDVSATHHEVVHRLLRDVTAHDDVSATHHEVVHRLLRDVAADHDVSASSTAANTVQRYTIYLPTEASTRIVNSRCVRRSLQYRVTPASGGAAVLSVRSHNQGARLAP